MNGEKEGSPKALEYVCTFLFYFLTSVDKIS